MCRADRKPTIALPAGFIPLRILRLSNKVLCLEAVTCLRAKLGIAVGSSSPLPPAPEVLEWLEQLEVGAQRIFLPPVVCCLASLSDTLLINLQAA